MNRPQAPLPAAPPASIVWPESQPTSDPQLVTRHFHGLIPYRPIWQAMREFTARRSAQCSDELWLLEHPPTYTLGLAGKREHLLQPDPAIELVHIDRGGQITYHGPGQLICYTLLDLHRRQIKVRELVWTLEQTLIELLADLGLDGHRRDNAPGVYVNDAKIAALGLRISRGAAYHGLALNCAMDLRPYQNINPCGYPMLRCTDLAHLGIQRSAAQIAPLLAAKLTRQLTAV